MKEKRRHESGRKRNPGKPEVNEYPRQGNQDPELGLVGEKGVQQVAEKEGEAAGKDIKRRIQKGKEGVSEGDKPTPRQTDLGD